jgi:hypothetical protein
VSKKKHTAQRVRSQRRRPHTGRGNFFAVDRRTWARICSTMDANTAAAYLVLARGTGPDNVTTSWSVHAVQTYLALSLGRAQTAVQALLRSRAVEQVQDGERPRYRVRRWSEIDEPPPLTTTEACVIKRVRSGARIDRWNRHAANLIHGGWVCTDGDYLVPAPELSPDPEWIWLPNTIVDGAASEVPPVRRVREIQDVDTLRLFVDCYDSHNLTEFQGIDPRVVQQKYERFEVGRRAQYVVWGFRRPGKGPTVAHHGFALAHERTNITGADRERGVTWATNFWRRFAQLEALGLIEWVPHLMESDASDAQPIHPYGFSGDNSLEEEEQIGRAASAAGAALLTDAQQVRLRHQVGVAALVPVWAHMQNVALVGIARLKYRPRTALTAAWYHNLRESGAQWIKHYTDLIQSQQIRRTA